MSQSGYFGIGVYRAKREDNIGTLWRGAYQLGANHIFTVGAKYKRQASDVFKTWLHIPLFTYDDVSQILDSIYDCLLVGVEMGGVPLTEFKHPQRCVYLLGSEDNGLPPNILAQCHHVVSIPSVRTSSYNVAQAGTIIMYDRMVKNGGLVNEGR
jgi:tRNA G18 (ribose-2'-O)-methylase SpoU